MVYIVLFLALMFTYTTILTMAELIKNGGTIKTADNAIRITAILLWTWFYYLSH